MTLCCFLDIAFSVLTASLAPTCPAPPATSPQSAWLGPWPQREVLLERQVAVLGPAEPISTAESIAYFVSRPFGSRLGAWVSQQSSVISSRSMLELQWEELKRRFAGKEVPLPAGWGGFRVQPQEMEFWQGRENRLHDRFRYRLANSDADEGYGAASWIIERIAP